MKTILLLMVALSLFGCYKKDREYIDIDDYSVYIIDNCEYIGSRFMLTNSAVLTHKGNCKFCAKRNNK